MARRCARLSGQRVPPGRSELDARARQAYPRPAARSCACSHAWRPPASNRSLPARREHGAAARAGRRARGPNIYGIARPIHYRVAEAVSEVLFSSLGLTPVRKGKTGLLHRPRCWRRCVTAPDVLAVEEWRELTKLLSTYLTRAPYAHRSAHWGRTRTFNQTSPRPAGFEHQPETQYIRSAPSRRGDS